MNTERLDAIRARLSAATPGPWEAVRIDLTVWVFSEDHRLEAKLGYVGNHPERDAEFISAAPSDVAFLLDLVRKQQAALDAVTVLANEDEWGRVYRDTIRDALDDRT